MSNGALISTFAFRNPALADAAGRPCKLIIEIGKSHLSYLLCSDSSLDVFAFEMFRSENSINSLSIQALIQNLQSKKIAFTSAHLVLNNGVVTMMPVGHFKADDAQRILQLFFPEQEDLLVFSDNVDDWSLVNVYGINKELYSILNERYNFVSVLHANKTFLNAVHVPSTVDAADILKVFFHPSGITLLVIKGNQLQLIQDQEYQTTEDVVYYLIQSTSQLGIDRETMHLRLSGTISADAAIYKELQKYFRNIDFELPQFKFDTSAENQVPVHFFTPAFYSLTCV